MPEPKKINFPLFSRHFRLFYTKHIHKYLFLLLLLSLSLSRFWNISWGFAKYIQRQVSRLSDNNIFSSELTVLCTHKIIVFLSCLCLFILFLQNSIQNT